MSEGEARLFIGLELDDGLRQALAVASGDLRAQVRGRLYDASLYHITLCFLGQTPRKAIARLGALMDGISFEPFSVELGRLGTFKNGSILWAGIKPPCEPLYRLQQALAEALSQAGFPVESGKYTPHITLGRRVEILGELGALPEVGMTVSRMTLFESTRIDGVLTYLPLYRSGGQT